MHENGEREREREREREKLTLRLEKKKLYLNMYNLFQKRSFIIIQCNEEEKK